jgi:hypothetical protein
MNAVVRGRNLTYSIANHIGIAIVTGIYSSDNPIPIEAQLCVLGPPLALRSQ